MHFTYCEDITKVLHSEFGNGSSYKMIFDILNNVIGNINPILIKRNIKSKTNWSSLCDERNDQGIEIVSNWQLCYKFPYDDVRQHNSQMSIAVCTLKNVFVEECFVSAAAHVDNIFRI